MEKNAIVNFAHDFQSERKHLTIYLTKEFANKSHEFAYRN